MKTVKELIDEINALKLNTPNAVEDTIDMEGITRVDTINLDEHRWYTNGTIVFKVGNEFFGVRGRVSMKSEESSWDDICAECQAFEMEEVPSVTYRKKSA
jgi:hypothetical protein